MDKLISKNTRIIISQGILGGKTAEIIIIGYLMFINNLLSRKKNEEVTMDPKNWKSRIEKKLQIILTP